MITSQQACRSSEPNRGASSLARRAHSSRRAWTAGALCLSSGTIRRGPVLGPRSISPLICFHSVPTPLLARSLVRVSMASRTDVQNLSGPRLVARSFARANTPYQPKWSSPAARVEPEGRTAMQLWPGAAELCKHRTLDQVCGTSGRPCGGVRVGPGAPTGGSPGVLVCGDPSGLLSGVAVAPCSWSRSASTKPSPELCGVPAAACCRGGCAPVWLAAHGVPAASSCGGCCAPVWLASSSANQACCSASCFACCSTRARRAATSDGCGVVNEEASAASGAPPSV